MIISISGRRLRFYNKLDESKALQRVQGHMRGIACPWFPDCNGVDPYRDFLIFW